MNNDLLPFPQDLSGKESDSNSSFLPGFPQQETGEQLTSDELIIVRKMIAEYKLKMPVKSNEETATTPVMPQTSLFAEETTPVSSLFCEDSVPKVSVSSIPFMPDDVKTENQTSIIQLLEKQKLGDTFESEALKKMIEFAKSADNTSLEYIAVSILGIIPCKKFIRHGTPEQKLFVLKSLGDRFLDGIAGLKWVDRRKLIKVVASYLSTISENYSFIPMEGELFNPTLHERVLGASTGNVIKEMRGFLVVAKGSNRVTYAGVVLT